MPATDDADAPSETGTRDDAAGPGEPGGDDGGVAATGGLSWGRAIVLAAAMCWLGGAVGWTIASRADAVDLGPVDTGFYLDMIAHHEQAVEMALIELGQGEDSTVVAFAREIIIVQEYEIGRMDEALRRSGVSRDDRGATAMEWMGMGVPVEAMPGMATGAQLEGLREATGNVADGLFLDLMAEHHRGGAHMAAYAADNAEDPAVRALAARMERNQAIEVNEFRQTAERLGLDVEIDPITAGG